MESVESVLEKGEAGWKAGHSRSATETSTTQSAVGRTSSNEKSLTTNWHLSDGMREMYLPSDIFTDV